MAEKWHRLNSGLVGIHSAFSYITWKRKKKVNLSAAGSNLLQNCYILFPGCSLFGHIQPIKYNHQAGGTEIRKLFINNTSLLFFPTASPLSIRFGRGLAASGPLFFQFPAEFLQRPFFNPGDVTAADTGDLRHFPLPFGTLSVEPVAQLNDLPLLLRQAAVHGFAQTHNHFFGGYLLQQVAVLTDHIH